MKTRYLNVSNIRKRATQNKRRISKSYIASLDSQVEELIDRACAVHNGGKKTLDACIAGLVIKK